LYGFKVWHIENSKEKAAIRMSDEEEKTFANVMLQTYSKWIDLV
jgi:hypothetical protein